MAGRDVATTEQVAFYDEWNEKFRSTDFAHIEPESRARGEKVLAVAARLRLPTPRILEVGCSTGWLAKELARFGSVVGTDLSPKAIEIARRLVPGVEFSSGDFCELDFPAASFGLVVSLETIFYVSDQDRFLRKIVELMQPGAYAILTSVNAFVYERRSDMELALQRGQVRQWLTRSELRRLLSRHLEIVSWTTALPKGDRGLLRMVNSTKVNALLGLFASEATIRGWKEALGFGHTHVILLRKP